MANKPQPVRLLVVSPTAAAEGIGEARLGATGEKGLIYLKEMAIQHIDETFDK